jgi:hypothetical protein
LVPGHVPAEKTPVDRRIDPVEWRGANVRWVNRSTARGRAVARGVGLTGAMASVKTETRLVSAGRGVAEVGWPSHSLDLIDGIARGSGAAEAMHLVQTGLCLGQVGWRVAGAEWDGSSPGHVRAVVKVAGAAEAMRLARTKEGFIQAG